MRRTITTLTFLLGFGLLLVGCDQVALDEAKPSQSIPANEAFSQIEAFQSTLTSTYDRLQSFTRYGQYYMLYPDAMADNAGFIQGANRYNAVTRNLTGAHLTAYGNPYDAINLSNTVIQEIQPGEFVFPENIPDSTAQRESILGQAYFLRALNYFDLMRTHAYEPGREVDGWSQGVIVRTEPTQSVPTAREVPGSDDGQAREPNGAVYSDRIIPDLEQAATLLEGKSLSKFRANEAAAYGLLARVHLYAENWSEAEQAATNAIDAAGSINASLMGPSDYPSAWFAESLPESLFELKMTSGQDGAATNTNESLASLSYAERGADQPASAGFRTFNFQVIPTADVIQTYPQGDVRRTLIDTLVSGNPVLAKYNQTLGSNADRVPVLRLAEMYLIRAEARTELAMAGSGNYGDARGDLNTLRTNRGLSNVGSGVSGQALIDSIYVERRRELVYEGHRFFDLKRRGMDVPKPQTNVARSVLPYDNFRVIAPFPDGEVRSIPTLEQNPGY